MFIPARQPLWVLGKGLEIRISLLLAGPSNDPADIRLAMSGNLGVAPRNLRGYSIVHPKVHDVQMCPEPGNGLFKSPYLVSVSYTHLTLPTNREV